MTSPSMTHYASAGSTAKERNTTKNHFCKVSRLGDKRVFGRKGTLSTLADCKVWERWSPQAWQKWSERRRTVAGNPPMILS
jgi:hypothetical protein